jgi:EAL and modified HD-GYP domain-containing signal transduction protein
VNDSTAAQPPADILMARQPIYDRNLRVFAYELLFRGNQSNEASFLDGNQATAQVLINAYTGFEPDASSLELPAFINLTKDLLLSEETPPLPKSRVVLEILEDVRIDDHVIERVRSLRKAGYRLALDDFVLNENNRQLLSDIDFVKIDIRQLTLDQLRDHVRLLKTFPKIKLLAEKVETEQEFTYCKELGFDLFQGYFLERPSIVKGKTLDTSAHVVLRLLQELQNPKVTAADIADIVSQDAGLTYKLLRIINSAAYALPQQIDSLSQAVVMLGFRQIRSWALIISLAKANRKPPEIMNKLMVRAATCERYARYTQHADTDSFFITGLFSGLDMLLGADLREVLEQLPLADDVKLAILERKGPQGRVLSIVTALENGDWEYLLAEKVDGRQLNTAYVEAIAWAKQSLEIIHS